MQAQNNSHKWGTKQFTKEQAIAFSQSGVWKTWTAEQIVRLQLFQRLLCMDFSVFHKAIQEVLGRPVFTHEFTFYDDLVKEYLGAKPAPTLDEILDLIPEEKRLILNV